MDESSKGWIVSLDYAMTAAVAIMSGQLQSMFGPKKTGLIACLPICLSWMLLAATPSMAIIYVSR